MADVNNSDGKENYAQNILEGYAKDWKIYIDTCSILHFATDKFWMNIIPLLCAYQNKVIVQLRSIEELEKNSIQGKADLALNAKNSLKIIEQLINAGFVEVQGKNSDNFASCISKYRTTHKLLLITQDNDLAKNIIALDGNRSVRANPVHVRQINEYGFLSAFSWSTENDTVQRQNKISKRMEKTFGEVEAFQICTSVTDKGERKTMDNSINVRDDSKKEFKDFIALLSSDICKSILQNDLNIFYNNISEINVHLKERQDEFGVNIKLLEDNITDLETKLNTVQILTQSFKEYGISISKSNEVASKAYEQTRNIENRLIENIEKKYINIYNELKQDSEIVLADLKKAYAEIIQKSSNSIKATNKSVIEAHISQLRSEQNILNDKLNSSVVETITQQLPQKKIEQIEKNIKNVDDLVQQKYNLLISESKNLINAAKKDLRTDIIKQLNYIDARTNNKINGLFALLITSGLVSLASVIILIIQLAF